MPEMRAGRTGAHKTGREVEAGGRREGMECRRMRRECFSSSFWFERDGRRRGEKVEFFNTAQLNTKALAGKGCGYKPPTAALGLC